MNYKLKTNKDYYSIEVLRIIYIIDRIREDAAKHTIFRRLRNYPNLYVTIDKIIE